MLDVEKEISSLISIGRESFKECDLTYSEEQSLLIPVSVDVIRDHAFVYNDNLLGIRYGGINQNILNNNGWYHSDVTTLNP